MAANKLSQGTQAEPPGLHRESDTIRELVKCELMLFDTLQASAPHLIN